jgi:hypothetical protein
VSASILAVTDLAACPKDPDPEPRAADRLLVAVPFDTKGPA